MEDLEYLIKDIEILVKEEYKEKFPLWELQVECIAMQIVHIKMLRQEAIEKGYNQRYDKKTGAENRGYTICKELIQKNLYLLQKALADLGLKVDVSKRFMNP